jgi:hypothetical protein
MSTMFWSITVGDVQDPQNNISLLIRPAVNTRTLNPISQNATPKQTTVIIQINRLCFVYAAFGLYKNRGFYCYSRSSNMLISVGTHHHPLHLGGYTMNFYNLREYRAVEGCFYITVITVPKLLLAKYLGHCILIIKPTRCTYLSNLILE